MTAPRSRRPPRAPLAVLAALALAACGHEEAAPAPPATGSVVFGVTSDLRPGVDVERVRVVMTEGGRAIDERTIAVESDGGGLAFPLEIAARDRPAGAEIALRLEAYLPGLPSAPPLVVRLAATRVVAGRTLLDPVQLQSACAAPISASQDAGIAGGWAACTAPDTCVDATCAASFTDPARLSDWEPAWNEDRPDPPCKPVLGQPPALALGEGQSDYLPVSDGEELQVEKGPQGGHHVWIAVRMKNLHGSGTRTRVTAVQPDTGTQIQPFEVIFTYDPDEGGWCKLYGLRFQLDAGGVALEPLLGKALTITVTATDVAGDHASATKTVMLSKTTI